MKSAVICWRSAPSCDTTLISAFRVLLPVLIKLLPIGTRTRWKARSAKLKEEQLTSQTFLSFLSLQALSMNNTEDSATKKRRSSPVRQNVRRQPRRHSTIDALPASLSLKCAVCHGEHHVTNCFKFLKQGSEKRKKTARTLYLCFRCYGLSIELKNRGWGFHHLLVLMSSNQQAQRQAEPDDHVPPLKQKQKGKQPPVYCSPTHAVQPESVKAIAHGANGKRLVINCLLYRGAEQTLVTEDRARALGLVGVAETVIVKGIGGIHCTPTLARRVGFRLSLVKTLARICDNIQSVPVRCGDWKHLQHLRIAKEQDEKLPVHVLISVDSYGRFLDEKILRGNPTDPVAIETTLG
ncbi:hypothetical protein T01_3945 [Trichinella spiralis]|uniref:Uncharacterized protein n=1 Tax=Trichinella spiralis TaxID=6334 RepID=A0A0V1BJQ3_TRISP|nr:hypothetical protein T01_3945 [Trichinella spiralis]